MANMILKTQSIVFLSNVRSFTKPNIIFQQSCRRKHVLSFKSNASVFRNLWRSDTTNLIIRGSPFGAIRLASTHVVEVFPPGTTKPIESLPPIPEPPGQVSDTAGSLGDAAGSLGDAAGSLGDAASALAEPTLQSLGLASWSPVGIAQQCLEFLHISCDLPWWGTIVVGTIVLRTMVFPLVILAHRNAAKMTNHLPQIQLLQLKMSEARQTGNQFEAAKYAQDLMMYMKEKDVSPMKSMWPPLAQAPLFISMFMGLRGMTNVPVDSLRTGGLFWFQDLTVADPYYLLPILTSVTLAITVELGTDTGKLSAQQGHMMKYFLRAMPVIIFPFTMNFPGAILCYWVSTNFISLIQVGILKIPQVREYLKIPKTVVHKKEDLPIQNKGFVKGFKESMTNMKITRELQERQNFDQVNFSRAGRAPIQRTFKYDPTKQPPTVNDLMAKKRD